MKKCGLCGEPMPEGEEMFNYHGYSGPCPPKKSDIEEKKQKVIDAAIKFCEWYLEGYPENYRRHIPGEATGSLRLMDAVLDLKSTSDKKI